MSSCAAQPQCSMKEPPAALLLRHEIDRPACASSASSESGSLELLLILHALVGATICGAQTNRSAQVERATRCSRRQDGDMRTPRGRVPVKVAVSCAAGPAQRRCIRAPGDFHQYPVAAASRCKRQMLSRMPFSGRIAVFRLRCHFGHVLPFQHCHPRPKATTALFKHRNSRHRTEHSLSR